MYNNAYFEIRSVLGTKGIWNLAQFDFKIIWLLYMDTVLCIKDMEMINFLRGKQKTISTNFRLFSM